MSITLITTVNQVSDDLDFMSKDWSRSSSSDKSQGETDYFVSGVLPAYKAKRCVIETETPDQGYFRVINASNEYEFSQFVLSMGTPDTQCV